MAKAMSTTPISVPLTDKERDAMTEQTRAAVAENRMADPLSKLPTKADIANTPKRGEVKVVDGIHVTWVAVDKLAEYEAMGYMFPTRADTDLILNMHTLKDYAGQDSLGKDRPFLTQSGRRDTVIGLIRDDLRKEYERSIADKAKKDALDGSVSVKKLGKDVDE